MFHVLDLSVVKGEKAKIQDTVHKAELASQAFELLKPLKLQEQGKFDASLGNWKLEVEN
jgi:hypothetical protein